MRAPVPVPSVPVSVTVLVFVNGYRCLCSMEYFSGTGIGATMTSSVGNVTIPVLCGADTVRREGTGTGTVFPCICYGTCVSQLVPVPVFKLQRSILLVLIHLIVHYCQNKERN